MRSITCMRNLFKTTHGRLHSLLFQFRTILFLLVQLNFVLLLWIRWQQFPLWTSLTSDQMVFEADMLVSECVMWSEVNSCVKNTQSYFKAAAVSLRMKAVAMFLSFMHFIWLIWDLLQIFLLCSCSQFVAREAQGHLTSGCPKTVEAAATPSQTGPQGPQAPGLLWVYIVFKIVKYVSISIIDLVILIVIVVFIRIQCDVTTWPFTCCIKPDPVNESTHCLNIFITSLFDCALMN